MITIIIIHKILEVMENHKKDKKSQKVINKIILYPKITQAFIITNKINKLQIIILSYTTQILIYTKK